MVISRLIWGLDGGGMLSVVAIPLTARLRTGDTFQSVIGIFVLF